jgi:hypothetical protein
MINERITRQHPLLAMLGIIVLTFMRHLEPHRFFVSWDRSQHISIPMYRTTHAPLLVTTCTCKGGSQYGHLRESGRNGNLKPRIAVSARRCAYIILSGSVAARAKIARLSAESGYT